MVVCFVINKIGKSPKNAPSEARVGVKLVEGVGASRETTVTHSRQFQVEETGRCDTMVV